MSFRPGVGIFEWRQLRQQGQPRGAGSWGPGRVRFGKNLLELGAQAWVKNECPSISE